MPENWTQTEHLQDWFVALIAETPPNTSSWSRFNHHPHNLGAMVGKKQQGFQEDNQDDSTNCAFHS